MLRGSRARRSAPARWALLVAAYAAALLVAELVLYGAYRVGLLSSFSLWRAPLQLLPMWLLFGWWGARQARRSVVTCSMRPRPCEGKQPRPWRRGQAQLAAGVFSFDFGSTGWSVVVPPGPEKKIRVERLKPLVLPNSEDGVLWMFKPVVLVLSGPDGDYELKISATDLDKVRRTLLPAVEPSS